MRKKLLIFFLIIYFYKINAYAYLDPGTGAIILQALAGAVAAIMSFIYYYGNKIKVFFKKLKKKKIKNN